MISGLGSVETICFGYRIRFSSLSKCRLKFAYEEISSHSVYFLIETLSLTVRPEALASQLHGEGECFASPIYLFLKKDRLSQVHTCILLHDIQRQALLYIMKLMKTI